MLIFPLCHSEARKSCPAVADQVHPLLMWLHRDEATLTDIGEQSNSESKPYLSLTLTNRQLEPQLLVKIQKTSG